MSNSFAFIRRAHVSAALSALAVVALACDPRPTSDGAPSATHPVLAAAVDRQAMESGTSRWYGMGTDRAHRLILDSISATPWVAFHRFTPDAAAAPGALVVTDMASGDAHRIVAEPAWTIRDVSDVRVDPQEDSTALVVLLLQRTRAVTAFLKATEAGDNSGALLIDGYLWQIGSGAFFGDGEVPVPITGALSLREAERFADYLRAAKIHFAGAR